MPDFEIHLLKNFVREIGSAQYTNCRAIELRPRRLIEAFEGSLVAFGDSGQQPDKFRRRQHKTSPTPRDSARPFNRLLAVGGLQSSGESGRQQTVGWATRPPTVLPCLPGHVGALSTQWSLSV